jgi:hypothetical protein
MPRWLRPIIALVLYLLLSTLVFAKTWSHPFTSATGIGADIPLFVWFLRWTPFALSHSHNPLVTNYLDYPDGVNMMWNGSMPLLGVLFAPITSTFGAVFCYNLLVTLALGFSAWCAYLAIRRYVPNAIAAGAGGLLYGFSPYMMDHALDQLHLIVAFIPPLMLLALDEILIRRRHRATLIGGLLGLLAAAQLLIAEELLATEAVVALLGTLLLVALHRRELPLRQNHALHALLSAAAVFFLVVAIPLGVQFLGPQRVQGVIQNREAFVSDLLAFFLPSRLQYLTLPALVQVTDGFSAGLLEWNSYLGIPLIALLAYTAVRFWSIPAVRFATLLGGIVALLSMGLLVHVAGQRTVAPVAVFALGFPLLRKCLPGRAPLYTFLGAWLALGFLPVLNNAEPVRLMLYVYLLAGLLLAYFIDATLRAPNRRSVLGGSLLALVALGTLIPRLPFPSAAVSVPPFFTTGAVSQIPEGSVALVAPYSHLLDGRAMLWQAASGMRFRMPEGYVVRPGPSLSPAPTKLGDALLKLGQGSALPELTYARRQEMLADLGHWKVQTIVVGPMEHQDRVLDFFGSLLDGPPALVDGVYVWWQLAFAESLTRGRDP